MPADNSSVVVSGFPLISKNGMPISDKLTSALTETIVDLDSTRPSMFVLRFVEAIAPDQDSGANFAIGDVISITEAESSTKLFEGEVTSLEAEFGPGGNRTVVRGYDKAHRLHRSRQYRVFLQKTDSDIAREIISGAGAVAGTIEHTSNTHEALHQVNQTNWDFLKWRAEENNLVLDTSDGKINLRKPDPPSMAALTLSVHDSLLAFRPRLIAPAAAQVVVKGWDEKQKQMSTDQQALSAATPSSASVSDTPNSLAGNYSPDPHVSSIRSVDKVGELTGIAKSIAQRYADSHIEAEGVALGHPSLTPGSVVEVKDAGTTFNGKYCITSARHVFNAEHRYTTVMRFTGLRDKSLLALTANATSADGNSRVPRINGVVSAIVTNLKDPESRCRVKLKFPWLDDAVETDWARTVQVGGGNGHGAVILPEVNDEVLVAFEQGDFRRPFILGGLYNGQDKPHDSQSYTVNGQGQVERRGFASRLGHKLVIEDTDSAASGIKLETADEKFLIYMNQKDTKITIDALNGKVEIHGSDDVSVKSDKNIAIEAMQKISITGKQGVDIKSDTGDVSMAGLNTKMTANAKATISGNAGLDLSTSAIAQLQGSLVKIN